VAENGGRYGPPAHVLEQIRAEAGGYGAPQPTGPFDPGQGQAPPAPRKRGFTAGEMWDGEWDITRYGGAKGVVPMPTQERIDLFRRRGAEFDIEAQRLLHEAQKAQAKLNAERRKAREKAASEGKDYIEPFSAKRLQKEHEEAEAEERRLYSQMRDFVAEFCAGSPTREQLDVLPDHEFRRFAYYLGEQLNPEV
jgi:hypothetical protein